MQLSGLNPRRLWSAENGLTSLLILTLIYLFVTCALSDFSYGDLVADLFFSLIIVAGVITTFRQRWVRFLAIFLAVVCLSLTWEQNIHPGGGLTILNLVLKLIFLGLLMAVLIVQVFGAGPVTAHRIRGAIVVYLLLGGAWSLLYRLVDLTTPHAFHLAEALATADPGALPRLLTYFSFTTLTTTGFGDISPANPLSRTLAMFEAMAGQLYLVITLARLVSQAIMCQKDNAPPGQKR
jgi:hypothetical protein